MLHIKDVNKWARKKAKLIVYAKMYRWLSENESDLSEFLKSVDLELWKETIEYVERLTAIGQEELNRRSITVGLPNQGVGGGAEYALLYFLVRHNKPDTVLETGVAMGWSSRAILDAMEANDCGHLFSSDLPYSSRPGREDVGVTKADVGCLVPESLRGRWTLCLNGDRECLPSMLDKIDSVDLFHYDSDKSYEGRRWAMDLIRNKMHSGSTIVMDDIKDNPYFMDYAKSSADPWKVLREKSSERWVGIIDVK